MSKNKLLFAGALSIGLILLLQNKASGSTGVARTIDGSGNLQAFLDTIGYSETKNRGNNGYNILFGGGTFSDYSRHPNKLITKNGYTSTAAGRYQFIFSTWERLRNKLNLPDFSPTSQDRAAIELLIENSAYSDAIQGDFDAAIYATNGIWASFPDNPYGQPAHSIIDLENYYTGYGGNIAA